MLENLVIKGLLTGLTPREKMYLLLHPHHIRKILDAKNKAGAEAKSRYGIEGIHNGKGDAFRHCFASAMLARDIGAENAKTFTTAHEAYGANPGGERQMDLNNNSMGITLAGTLPKDASDTALANACSAAITEDKLTLEPVAGGARYPE